jgi:predicted MPP superfamily phosphohydrolase
LKLRYILIILVIFLIGFVLIRMFAPNLSIPYFNFAFLFIFSIYIWGAIYPKIYTLRSLPKNLITFFYWLPMLASALASIVLIFRPLDDWPDFVRVYFIGGIFTYVMSMLIASVFLLLADLISMVERIIDKVRTLQQQGGVHTRPKSRRKFIVNTGLTLGGLTLGTLGFGMLRGNYDFKVWKHTISSSRIPDSLRGLKIVQISDFHLGTWVNKKPLIEAVNAINKLNADLVFFTGDLVNSMTEEAFVFKEELSKIRSKYGVFASLGNHDYGNYYNWNSKEEKEKNWTDLLNFYEEIGWKLLRNEHELLEINNSRINIIGVENWSLNPRFPQYGDIQKATEGIQASDLNLLMSHDPTHWDMKVKDFELPIDITFSGHTHGFQFGIESKLFRWSPAQYIYKHWAGLYKNESAEKFLYVNRGIGAIGFPGRVGIKPEITVIELA